MSFSLPHSSMNLIEISKLNISLFIDFISQQKKNFNCFILPDLSNLLNLINSKTLHIYGIIQHDQLISCYVFRDSHMIYNKDKAVELFASISNCSTERIFINGFTLALKQLAKQLDAKLLTIENISHNYYLINYIKSLNNSIRLESPTAYFFYNYRKRPISFDKTFILC